MDNIDRMMKEADRLGFGVSYGKYRAAYPNGSSGANLKAAAGRSEKPSATCRHCGKPFVIRHGNQQYCSGECRDAVVMARQRKWEKDARKRRQQAGYVKVCAVCAADFRTSDSRKKYCCEECQKKGRRRNAALWRLRQKGG